MVFRQVGNDTDKLINKLGILNKSFADIKMDFQNGQGIRSLSNIISKQDVANFEKFQQDLKDGISYHKAFNNNLAQSHTYVQQQAVRLRELNVQQKLLNRQLTTGKITQAEYKTAMSANQAQVKSLTTQTQTLTFAQKASAVASKVMGTALKTALNIGLMLAINAIISGIIKLVNRQEEAKQKAEELRQKAIENAEVAKEETSKIADLISQYEKFKDVTSLTADDKENLKSIQDQLIETFGKEAEGLDLVNGKYDEQLQKLNEISAKKLKENENTLVLNRQLAKDNFENNKQNEFWFSDEKKINNNDVRQIGFDISRAIEGFYMGETSDMGYTSLALREDLNAEEKVKTLEKAINLVKTNGLIDSNLFEYLVNLQNSYREQVDAYSNATNDLAQNIVEIFALENGTPEGLAIYEYNNWVNDLLATINDSDVELQKAVQSVADTLYGDKLDKKILSSGNGISENLSESLKTSLSEYEDQISDFLSEKDKIDSALKEQEENGSISASTAFELSKLGYKSAVKYDSETKAYKLLRSEINKTAESRIAETKAKLESEKASAIQSIKDETENWRKNTGRTKDDIMYLDKLDKNKVAINEISDAYDLYIRMLEYADEGTSEYADSISKVNEELERQKTEIEKLDSGQSTIDKAIEEQKEFGHLSASSIKALHEAGLGTALAYNEATGETTLLIDSIEELYQAMIKAQEEAAKISLNNLATEIEEIENRLNNFSVNSAGDARKKASLESDLAEKKSQYNTQQQNLQEISSYKFSFNSTSEDVQQSAEDAVEEYINSIKEAFDKEKSDLDHLLNMDVISQEEYYNRLFDLNEKYFKGKTELLDEYRQYEEEVYKGLKETQIKAIQEQIDALKSVNEEKQEEIDLEKAKQALENAKRQKTISVYDSERGWIRETDRNAIDSAQKEYDDLVLNEKVEALENLIDAIENGTNTNHNLDESVNAFEQVNNLGQRVISGNVDLTQLFSGAVANRMNEIQNSINSNIPIALANQFDKSISSDSYTTNNNNTITLNGVTVMANNPEEFIAQMEDIANERFKENFPAAMNQFGRDLKRYQMNHSF